MDISFELSQSIFHYFQGANRNHYFLT